MRSLCSKLRGLSLKKEADQLKARLKNTEAITKAAKRKYYEETKKLSELQYQFKAANDIQQEAYVQLQCLKKQSHEKNKHFWQYKDDLNKADELAWKGDKVALQNFCINQVRCNERSTLWRLRTLDGRVFGPGEVPPVIPRALNGRAIVDHTMSGLTLEDRTQELVAVAKAEKVLAEKVVEQKKFMKSAPPESVSTTASNGDKIEEAEEEKTKRTKEQEESDRKAEELRKEEEAAKLKEQRRFEEIAKAKEALERNYRKL
ncbi:proton pump-interactor 1-like [Gossypium arboreum]|uniref:proton pump-interactor 1-like n=1 Tax=Gossypium arboreum TaxID=29729 RepID=UPI000818F333|nr:proton pump-interactor 1-like [Gossypium arboreum]